MLNLFGVKVEVIAKICVFSQICNTFTQIIADFVNFETEFAYFETLRSKEPSIYHKTAFLPLTSPFFPSKSHRSHRFSR